LRCGGRLCDGDGRGGELEGAERGGGEFRRREITAAAAFVRCGAAAVASVVAGLDIPLWDGVVAVEVVAHW
jgi:hypothetical protein